MGGAANPNMVQPMGGMRTQGGISQNGVQGYYNTEGNFTPYGGLSNQALTMSRTPMAQPQPATPQNPYQQASQAQTGAMNMVGAGANVVGGALGALNPAMQRVNQGMTQTAAEGMSTYQNPYEDAVVQASLRDIGNKGLSAQNTLGAQAQRAGAFGGSRHGIAEAELAKSTQQQMLDQAARLRQQGFNTAVGAAQADMASQLGAAGQSAGMAGQAAGMGGQLAGMGSALSGLGQTSFGYGQAIQNQQMQQGAMQQQLMQNLINAAKGQYGQYASAPMNKLQLPLAALGAAPVPQSQIQERDLGLYDYLTAGASFMTGMPSFMG